MKGKITTLIVGLVLGSTSVKRRQKITIENRRELHNLSGDGFVGREIGCYRHWSSSDSG